MQRLSAMNSNGKKRTPKFAALSEGQFANAVQAVFSISLKWRVLNVADKGENTWRSSTK